MPGPEIPAPEIDQDITLPLGSVHLAGHLTIPGEASEIVVFAHGSGSSRHSPRNRHVAASLNDDGLGTLLFDLLTTDEERDRRKVFDIPLLGERLRGVSSWVRSRYPGCSVAYFGASTGAGAALWAAADQHDVSAVVSRGGRPDLAGPRLSDVRAPTLLIVGSRDPQVLQLNEQARSALRCESDLEVVSGATHLFEEPGALDQVADLASRWFRAHLPTDD